MPVQTTKKNLYFADGCKVEIDDGSGWFDVGAISSAVTATLEFTESLVETANAGPTDKMIRAMTISGGFELINLEPAAIKRLGGGIFDLVETTGGRQTPDSQTITGVSFGKSYPLILKKGGGHELRPMAQPAITSVTGTGNKTQNANRNFLILEDAASSSGYSISFISGSAGGVGAGDDVVIVYGATEIRGSQTLYVGSSSQLLKAVGMRCTHLDSAGKKRSLELFAVEASSGGFQFNFKGSNEEGVESMPLSFSARLDTTRTDKRQLAAWTIEDGAA